MRRSFFVSSLVLVALAALVLPEIAAAQDLHPSRRPSPMAMARTHVGDAYVRVVYSRPYLRGRDNIFGTAESEALVPFGQIWRTGANEATEITTTKDLKIGDQVLPAGTYSLFTTPGAESWKVHFNSRLGLSGTACAPAGTDFWFVGSGAVIGQRGRVGDDPLQHLRRRQHARHPRSGVRSGADKE